MRCFYPITAYQPIGGGRLVFQERENMRALSIRCGRCIGCRLARAQGWAVRCMHEAELYDNSSFITLTYDDDHNPVTLVYPHFQKFMKRVRKKFGPTRFFMCGEYGEDTRRPHFHAILFGVFFEDRVVQARTASGCYIYSSATLSDLWRYGFSSVGDVSAESAGYVARYSCKKVTGEGAEFHYVDESTGLVLEPEFCHMSLKPGIGLRWLQNFKSDVYGDGKNVVRVGSVAVPVPKYYDKYLQENFDDEYNALILERYSKSFRFAEDSTPQRLAVQEQVAKARLSVKKRGL